MCTFMCIHTYVSWNILFHNDAHKTRYNVLWNTICDDSAHSIQGGEDAQDALSCRSFFAKEPIIIRIFGGKWLLKLRHPMASPPCNVQRVVWDRIHDGHKMLSNITECLGTKTMHATPNVSYATQFMMGIKHFQE